mmetsp:Transcript_108685/g.188138  ORF Transcript_108685/g.188138 Transcript_108685/m.188138 type:complete len:89 (-) Transcript_108685:1452-1718(-)
MSPAKKTGTSVDVISFCQKLLEDAPLCVRIISCWERLNVGNRLRRIDVIFRCCLQTKSSRFPHLPDQTRFPHHGSPAALPAAAMRLYP